MKSILVTGARAPAALELCRRLKQQGFNVIAADSLRFPLCRWSSAVDTVERFTAPNVSASRFASDLSAIIKKHKIDVVIPTCEEVFHIAKLRHRLPQAPEYFLDSIDVLSRLHDKFQFSQAMKAYETVRVPESELVTNFADLERFISSKVINGRSVEDIVIKRVFSRFAEGTLVKPSHSDLQKLKETSSAHYVVQEYVKGPEFSCYAAASYGKLRALSIYHSRYRAGKGAGIFFMPVKSRAIESFVCDFIEKENFHGQVSFDFMTNGNVDDVPYVLECNPRATSGIHLLQPETDWLDILGFRPQTEDVWQAVIDPHMVALAMLTYGLLSWDCGFVHSLKSGKDVIGMKGDRLPVIGQFLSMSELISKAWATNTSSLSASTADIEWNQDA